MTAPQLAPDDFGAFFRAVHGVDPFPWQARLLKQIAAKGVWPDVLDLPTGSGKTASLDIAVFHLALEATRGQQRWAPVRIAFIVDRRLIVDDAFERAHRLAEALAAPKDPVVMRVRAELCRLAGQDEKPLLARRLRGGMPREDDWARSPVQPTILCSTVDQVGSRVLFRGYGISDRMKPVHAGLLGSDCLFLLDEAHLSGPFRQTLAGIERLREGDDAPWGVAFLTATPGKPAERPFGLCDDDRAHPLLARRLQAPKPARLVDIPRKQGAEPELQRVEAITEQAKATVDDLRKYGVLNPAIGVVVNRVARARAVFERLRGELQDSDVTLIIGPARTADREARSKELNPIRTRHPDAPRTLEKALIIVATQTIEAGVDIDLDGLVTEVAALDALRQRFGRLNRGGRRCTPFAAVLAYRDDIAAKADDPVYRDRAAETWKELQALAAVSSEGLIDFGIEAFGGLLKPQRIGDLAAPTENAPVLLPAYADLWSHTSPIPNSDPDIALFLHGPDRSPARIRVVWRADIAEEDLTPSNRERLIELLKFVPPRGAEAIEVPLWAAQAWLRHDYDPLLKLSDVAGRTPDDGSREQGRRAFRYAGTDDPRTGPVDAGELRPGDLIVAPAGYGGCDEWGWNPEADEPVNDIAEAAASPYRARRFAVRVTPELVRQGRLSGGHNDRLPDRGKVREDLSSILAVVREESADRLLDAVLGLDWLPQQMRDLLGSLEGRKRRLERSFDVYGNDQEEQPKGVVLVAPFGLKGVREAEDAAAPVTEADELGSAAGYAQSLDDHSAEVKQWAIAFGQRAGLCKTAADLALAAYLHDAGKADPRFQAYLSGGDPFGWDERRVLAKSGRPFLQSGAWELANLPPRWRHEALSVRLAQLHPCFADATDPTLVLWLVGVHHGFGRPLFPHADRWDEQSRTDLPRALGVDWLLEPGFGPQSLAFEFDGRDWAQMYEDLKRRYGIWGLARLEVFVRLADHRASEAAARRFAEEAPR
jgi:CRISPR-associated endonuclease/helicase Cas3